MEEHQFNKKKTKNFFKTETLGWCLALISCCILMTNYQTLSRTSNVHSPSSTTTALASHQQFLASKSSLKMKASLETKQPVERRTISNNKTPPPLESITTVREESPAEFSDPKNSNSLESVLLSPQSNSFLDPNTGKSVLRTFYNANKKGRTFSALENGNCWCIPSPDGFCSCTPSVAIDVILASGPSHVWLIKRKKENKLACMGGFVEVGETTEEAVARELMEETSLTLSFPPRLFGVYSDPIRDLPRHRHSVSIVYIVYVTGDQIPVAGDDASEIIRVHVADLEKEEYFIDHKTILMDYKKSIAGNAGSGVPKDFGSALNYNVPVKRTVCHDPNAGYLPDFIR